MPDRSAKQGFTLVELLVIITIIAILSAIGTVVYSNTTLKARDARRKLDLQLITQALEIYYQKNGKYPISDWAYSDAGSSWIPSLVPDYLSNVPVDPKANNQRGWSNGDLGYGYCSDTASCAADCSALMANGQFYAVVAILEDGNDPSSLNNKDYKWCNGSSLRTTYSWSGKSFVVTSQQ